MKWPKRILVALGIIALIIGCIYGYFFYENYQIRQKLIQGRNHYQTGKFNAVLAGLQEVYKKNPHSPEGVEAAYLLAKGFSLAGKENMGVKITIKFDKTSDIEKESMNYYNGALVEAKQYSDSYRTLKDYIFTR